MTKFAIRFLTLAVFVTAAVAVPLIVPATAAAQSTQVKKKHQKQAGQVPAPQPESLK
jgi:curli biogenesis system outer membrane secretion channel CsgG